MCEPLRIDPRHPGGHFPDDEGLWAEDHILCARCKVQIYEGTFFLEPCAAAIVEGLDAT
jgi:hypothetical protein